MTIKAIETLRLGEFPNLTWVIVEDADGLRGLGETYRGASEVEAYIHDTAAARLIGADALGVEPARGMLRPYVGHQAAGSEMRGNSAIDIAMWDLWGKRTGQPLWRLLGGRCREKIRTYNTCAGYRYMRQATG
ncbi:MAG TPA: mandelate racemase/muconate lactonizing enzyme family protein, partial [Kiloniellaceae bacterium]|nr:mandelate racemase/muconate lactonizing enzyme family protein [Kiloniellaceae bacterium]